MFRVQGLRVYSCRIKGLSSGFGVQGSGFRVWSLGFRFEVLDFRFEGLGFEA